MIRNIRLVHKAFDLQGISLREMVMHNIKFIFKGKLAQNMPPVIVAKEIEETFKLSAGVGLYLFRHFIATREITVNMNHLLD